MQGSVTFHVAEILLTRLREFKNRTKHDYKKIDRFYIISVKKLAIIAKINFKYFFKEIFIRSTE